MTKYDPKQNDVSIINDKQAIIKVHLVQTYSMCIDYNTLLHGKCKKSWLGFSADQNTSPKSHFCRFVFSVLQQLEDDSNMRKHLNWYKVYTPLACLNNTYGKQQSVKYCK